MRERRTYKQRERDNERGGKGEEKSGAGGERGLERAKDRDRERRES